MCEQGQGFKLWVANVNNRGAKPLNVLLIIDIERTICRFHCIYGNEAGGFTPVIHHGASIFIFHFLLFIRLFWSLGKSFFNPLRGRN
jgi:hypothetical protein